LGRSLLGDGLFKVVDNSVRTTSNSRVKAEVTAFLKKQGFDRELTVFSVGEYLDPRKCVENETKWLLNEVRRARPEVKARGLISSNYGRFSAEHAPPQRPGREPHAYSKDARIRYTARRRLPSAKKSPAAKAIGRRRPR